jgi:aminoglycoside phosphotransferase (APT) family kinase protein
MRIPPLTAPADRDNGIVREWRIIEALNGTDVPHTQAIAVCTDPSVLGRTFYLMGFVEGWSPMQSLGKWPAPFDTDVEARRGLAYQLVEGAALLSKVDWRAKGLEELGRPEGFHERQVDRWTKFLERIKGRELPGFDEAAAWLRAHRANVMFHDGAPARLAAIVDWEMGTIGDPKLDLGWVMQSWPENTDSGEGSVGDYVDMTGMPSRSEVLEHYAQVSGRQVDDIDYYCVLAQWKLAVILEQGYQRANGDPKLEAFGPVILDLMQGAAELAERSDYRR